MNSRKWSYTCTNVFNYRSLAAQITFVPLIDSHICIVIVRVVTAVIIGIKLVVEVVVVVVVLVLVLVMVVVRKKRL
jgi:hypothetical protein